VSKEVRIDQHTALSPPSHSSSHEANVCVYAGADLGVEWANHTCWVVDLQFQGPGPIAKWESGSQWHHWEEHFDLKSVDLPEAIHPQQRIMVITQWSQYSVKYLDMKQICQILWCPLFRVHQDISNGHNCENYGCW
jgi:hypothetical protein